MARVRSFFVEEPRYAEWLDERPSGFVAMRASDGRLAIHHSWCPKARHGLGASGGMVGVRICADARDDLAEWAGPDLLFGMSDCPLCSMPVRQAQRTSERASV